MTTVATARPVSATASRWSMIMIWASWPIGFGLIMAHTIGGVLGRPMFLLAIVVYVGVLAAALRARGLGTGPRRDDRRCARRASTPRVVGGAVASAA